jgi:soluble lytic murein transglycosylase
MRRAAWALWFVSRALAGQATPSPIAHAESLSSDGRPWHAAETFVSAGGRLPLAGPAVLMAHARAELGARRYDRARALLIGQPWLADSADGLGLALLAEAEAGAGDPAAAAAEFVRARAGAVGARAALLAVRAARAFEQAGARDSAARYYDTARRSGLEVIGPWLRVRQAAVTADTAVVDTLLLDLPFPASREAPRARARAALGAGDSLGAERAFVAAGAILDAARVALARRDSGDARGLLYQLFSASPETDDAAAGVALAQGPLPPHTPTERLALAAVLRTHGDVPAGLAQVRRAIVDGDSSGPTLVAWGELLTVSRRDRSAASAFAAAARRDSTVRPLATYRRARVLIRLGEPDGISTLVEFAHTFPTDSAASSALYLAGDLLVDRGDRTAAVRAFHELIDRFPSDPRSTVARFRLAAWARGAGQLDSAAAWYSADLATGGGPHAGARFWLGALALARGDSGDAQSRWTALAHDDSIGYYGLRARNAAHLPPLTMSPATPVPPPADVAVGLGRIDTLLLAGLDTAAAAEVRALLANPPDSTDALLAWSDGLAVRGWGSSAVRLGWMAAARHPNDPRAVRAIFPWPNRRAVEAEAAEFGVDPLLLAALVRQESVFDREALSRAGARGLAQLLPSTAQLTARGLDLPFAPQWITIPDLNLHLGAAHLAQLLRHFRGRVDAAVAAYDAGTLPVDRWLVRPGGSDPDQFLEDIPFLETRGYVRTVLRNRELYRALYPPAP